MDELFATGGCFIIGIAVVIGVVALRTIRMLYQYERGVVFTLGKYSDTRSPGVTMVVPILQSMRTVDMRIKTAEIPARRS